ncbi:MAG TPA: hypothetical protein VMI54_23005 [Polyangiaceae bacterium]|nr:hypothetical protein [Polyangiaceae bacterium]
MLASLTAFAQSVVLVRPETSDEVLVEAFNRLRGELGAQHFEVIVVDAPEGASTPEAIDRLAQDKGAFAAISFTRRADTTTADVWLADRTTGKTTVRTLALTGVPDAPSVLAVRSVDLLRESLRELDSEKAPPPEVVHVDRRPVPPAVRAFARSEPPPWRLRLEGTALDETAGIGTGYGVGLALSRRLSQRFRAGIALAGPLIGASYRSTNGTASVRQELAWLELELTAYESGPFVLAGVLGAGAYHLEARSEVEPPLVSRQKDLTSFATNLGVLLELHATEAVSVEAGAAALALTPRPGVAIAEQRTLFREPLLRAYAGMGVDF